MKFFVVVRAKGQLMATKRYETYEEAKTEATRLAQKERAKFHVLGCVGTVDIQLSERPTRWTYEAPQGTQGDIHGELRGEDAEHVTGALRGVGAQIASGIGSRGQEKD